MPAENVPLVIEQGEDFSAQILWTDEWGAPQQLTAPMRLDIKSADVFPVLSLTTPETNIPDNEIPLISYSADIGLIQIHIPKSMTVALKPGVYTYDMFVTVNDGDAYVGNQVVRLLVGQVLVNRRITVMS